MVHNALEEVMVKPVLSRIMKVPGKTLEAPKEAPVPVNEEISIIYNYSKERWNTRWSCIHRRRIQLPSCKSMMPPAGLLFGIEVA